MPAISRPGNIRSIVANSIAVRPRCAAGPAANRCRRAGPDVQASATAAAIPLSLKQSSHTHSSSRPLSSARGQPRQPFGRKARHEGDAQRRRTRRPGSARIPASGPGHRQIEQFGPESDIPGIRAISGDVGWWSAATEVAAARCRVSPHALALAVTAAWPRWRRASRFARCAGSDSVHRRQLGVAFGGLPAHVPIVGHGVVAVDVTRRCVHVCSLSESFPRAGPDEVVPD